MTLLDRILARGFEMPVDPILATRIERHMRRIKPDPLFQRRLRGQVMYRYVATREGMVAATAPRGLPRRRMGMLGRGVLYASLLTAVSVTAVGAAAQESLPGDPLYGVKIELESIRMHLAPPAMRDDLARMALDERLDEVEALAAAGRWAQLEGAVAAVERAETALQRALGAVGSEPGSSSAAAALIDEHVDRLTELLATAPNGSKRGLQRALAATGSTPSEIHSDRDEATGNRGQRNGQHVVPVTPTATPASTTAPATPTPTPAPTATPTPEDEQEGQQGNGQQGGSGANGPGSTSGNAKGDASAR